MNIPKVIPKFTKAKTSKAGWLNKEDVQKIARNALLFLTPTIALYSAQLLGALNDHTALSLIDFLPSKYVIGAFEGYAISTVLDYLKKLNSAK